MSAEALYAIAAMFEVITLAAVTGMVIALAWLLPATHPHPALPAMKSRIWLSYGLLLLVLVATSFAGLLIRTASMADVTLMEAMPHLTTVLTQTHFGQVWLGRLVAITLAFIALFLHRRHTPSALVTASLAILTFSFIIATSGHTGEEGLFSLTNLANTVHIIGGMLWGGGILVTAIIVLARLCKLQPAPNDLIAHASLKLSTLAAIALVMVLIPGIYNAYLLIGDLKGLWSSHYGVILTIKIVLVLIMMGLGALNRYTYVPATQTAARLPAPDVPGIFKQLFPKVDDDKAARGFLRSLRIEGLVLIIVLALAGWVSQQTPAVHALHDEHEHHHDHE